MTETSAVFTKCGRAGYRSVCKSAGNVGDVDLPGHYDYCMPCSALIKNRKVQVAGLWLHCTVE